MKGSGKLGIQELEVEAGLCWRVVIPQRNPDFLSTRQAPARRRPLDVLLAARLGLRSFPEQGSKEGGDELTTRARGEEQAFVILHRNQVWLCQLWSSHPPFEVTDERD